MEEFGEAKGTTAGNGCIEKSEHHLFPASFVGVAIQSLPDEMATDMIHEITPFAVGDWQKNHAFCRAVGGVVLLCGFLEICVLLVCVCCWWVVALGSLVVGLCCMFVLYVG